MGWPWGGFVAGLDALPLVVPWRLSQSQKALLFSLALSPWLSNTWSGDGYMPVNVYWNLKLVNFIIKLSFKIKIIMTVNNISKYKDGHISWQVDYIEPLPETPRDYNWVLTRLPLLCSALFNLLRKQHWEIQLEMGATRIFWPLHTFHCCKYSEMDKKYLMDLLHLLTP